MTPGPRASKLATTGPMTELQIINDQGASSTHRPGGRQNYRPESIRRRSCAARRPSRGRPRSRRGSLARHGRRIGARVTCNTLFGTCFDQMDAPRSGEPALPVVAATLALQADQARAAGHRRCSRRARHRQAAAQHAGDQRRPRALVSARRRACCRSRGAERRALQSTCGQQRRLYVQPRAGVASTCSASSPRSTRAARRADERHRPAAAHHAALCRARPRPAATAARHAEVVESRTRRRSSHEHVGGGEQAGGLSWRLAIYSRVARWTIAAPVRLQKTMWHAAAETLAARFGAPPTTWRRTGTLLPSLAGEAPPVAEVPSDALDEARASLLGSHLREYGTRPAVRARDPPCSVAKRKDEANKRSHRQSVSAT